MTHEQLLKKLLTELGNTASEVAETLNKRKFKGNTRNCRRCPISMYIKAHSWASLAVITSYERTEVYESDESLLATVQLPDAVASFAIRFDNGDYPYLIA